MNTSTAVPTGGFTPAPGVIPSRFKQFARPTAVIVVLGCLVSLTWPVFGQLAVPTTPDSRTTALQSEMDDAMQKVRTIVNQPVPAVRRTAAMQVGTFQPGWFHEGATKPDFNSVDVRLARDTTAYDQHPYVTSDLNPGLAWVSRTVEFNPMTKFFYTNYTLPKKRLTEPEMVEINRLYRVIGKCEQELASLQPKPVEAEEVDDPAGGLVLKPIPKERYILAAVAIVVVLGIYFLVRKAR